MKHPWWLVPPALALVSAAHDVAASNVSPNVVLARRGDSLLTRDRGRSVAVTFVSAPTARDLAELRAQGVDVRDTPLVTGAYVATIDEPGLSALARSPRVARVESMAPLLRLHDAEMVRGTNVDAAFRGALGETGHWLDGAGTTIGDVDSDVFVFHPSLFRADAGAYPWIDVDGDGTFRPGVDAIDLDRDGIAGAGEVAASLRMETRNLQFAEFDARTTFDATLDYVYLDANANGRRDYGVGFTEETPAFGEPIFVADDVNGNGKLDPGERWLRLGRTKLAKINREGLVYERGARKGRGIIDYGNAVVASVADARAPAHGTYMTAIIAGGNGSNRYRGIAPGADLVVVTTPDVESVNWLVEQPGITSVAMPIGSWFDPLDGSSQLDMLVDALWQRGVVTSVSVGNNGTGDGHGTLNLSPDTEASVEIEGTYGTKDLYVNVVTRAPGATLAVDLVDGTGAKLETQTSAARSPRGTAYTFAVTLQKSAIGKVTAKIRMTGATAPALAHVFTMGSFGQELKVLSGGGAATTLGSPATADTNLAATGWVIHTGMNYGSRDPVGALASFASRGPRLDGRVLSGLAAPVNPVAATIVSDALDRIAVRAWPGTSAASPQVAAAAALLKQHDPSLSAEAIREKLLGSARREGTLDPNLWGAGKLDVRAALGVTAVSKPPPEVAIEIVPGDKRRLHLATTHDRVALRARWDFDYDGTWDTDWERLDDVDAPPSGAVRVAVHDDAGNVVGATTSVSPLAPPAPSPVEAAEDGGCTIARPGPSTSGYGPIVAAAIAAVLLRRRRERRLVRDVLTERWCALSASTTSTPPPRPSPISRASRRR